MTISAGKPLRPIVRIVLRVTGVTVAAEGDLEYRLHVAQLALELAVRAVQRMSGVESVIEGDRGPSGRGVTIDAAASEVLVMSVIVRVAGNAFRAKSIREGVFAVTVAAGLLGVGASERERSVSRVIEARFQPTGRVVAGLAVLSATSTVGIVGRVAPKAGRRRVTKRPVGVAVQTLSFAMSTE